MSLAEHNLLYFLRPGIKPKIVTFFEITCYEIEPLRLKVHVIPIFFNILVSVFCVLDIGGGLIF